MENKYKIQLRVDTYNSTDAHSSVFMKIQLYWCTHICIHEKYSEKYSVSTIPGFLDYYLNNI